MSIRNNNVIFLKYFTAPNFGDALSPYLLKELSGMEVKDKTLTFQSIWEYLFYVVECIIKREYYGLKLIEMPWNKVLIAVGSMLKYSKKNNQVWGCGFMNFGESCQGGIIYAVRGKLSNDRLKELGLICKDVVLGDPALLLPLIVASPLKLKKKYKIGLIPHYKETEWFYNKFKDQKIIDLRTRNIQRVVEEICSCEYILSSSLHGLIVSHAYGIPALWVRNKESMDTDGFKFLDYFSSVGIKNYVPYDINSIDFCYEGIIEDLFINNKSQTLIQLSLKEIQKSLLKVAPFDLCNKYQILY